MERLHKIKKEAYAENFSCLSHWEPKKAPELSEPAPLWSSPFYTRHPAHSEILYFYFYFFPLRIIWKTSSDWILNPSFQVNWDKWIKRQLHQIFKNGDPPRLVSTTVFTINAKNPSRVNTALLMSMGQFIDHDITHVPMRSKYVLDRQKSHKVHIFWEGHFSVAILENLSPFYLKLLCSVKNCLGTSEYTNFIWVVSQRILGSLSKELEKKR